MPEKILLFLSPPIWLLTLTIVVFYVVQKLRTHTNNVLLNPVLITTIGVITYLKFFDIRYRDYYQSGQFLSFWLQPAVVCLAIPLYLQWQKIKKQWLWILLCEVVGSVTGIVTGMLLVKLLGGDEILQRTIAAKSVTVPIYLDITHTLEGLVELGVAGVMTAGILGQMLGIWWLRWIKITNPISQGLAIGTSSHALGIAAAWELNPKIAAFATLGLIINGILTAVFAPLIAHWLF